MPLLLLCARRRIASPPLPRCGMTWPDSIHCSRSPISRDPALFDASLAARRFTMLVILTFAVIAVALSVIGVYGELAYLVAQRRREIGLRLAIGASPSDVVWLFVREGAALTLVGLGAGLAGALAAGRLISALLFGVTPAIPVTLRAWCARWRLRLGVRRTCLREGRLASIQTRPSRPSRSREISSITRKVMRRLSSSREWALEVGIS